MELYTDEPISDLAHCQNEFSIGLSRRNFGQGLLGIGQRIFVIDQRLEFTFVVHFQNFDRGFIHQSPMTTRLIGTPLQTNNRNIFEKDSVGRNLLNIS